MEETDTDYGGARIGMIVSLGLNVNISTSELRICAQETAHAVDKRSDNFFVWPPSSLRSEIGNPLLSFDVGLLRELVTMDLNDAIHTFTHCGYRAFTPAICGVMLRINEEISFAPHGRERPERVEGRLKGLDEDGWLILEEESGRIQKYCSGELCST